MVDMANIQKKEREQRHNGRNDLSLSDECPWLVT
jgi:hypothetical protein